jgi:predicted transcriptional regulator
MKTTLDISDELYRAIKVEAAHSDRSVRDIVEEALQQWLEAAEDAEDAAASDAALAEYERDGGIDAREVFGHLAAEHAAAYDTRPR